MDGIIVKDCAGISVVMQSIMTMPPLSPHSGQRKMDMSRYYSKHPSDNPWSSLQVLH